MARPKPVWREVVEALLIAVLFATFAKTFVVRAFKIPSGSMAPELEVGDHILVNRFIFAPAAGPIERRLLPMRTVERGDVVVFRYPRDPRRDFIKRCVALPGDTVEIADKELLVNEEPVDESGYAVFGDERIYPRSRFLPEVYRKRDNFGPYEVPAGHYFCLGDNRDDSHDSRAWGAVPASYVKGRALLIYFSYDPGGETTAEGSDAASGTAGEPSRGWKLASPRWGRSLRLVR